MISDGKAQLVKAASTKSFAIKIKHGSPSRSVFTKA